MLFTSGTKNIIGFCDNTKVKRPICLYSRNFLNIFNFTPLKAKIPDPCSVLSLPCCLLLQADPNIREKSDEPNIQIITIIIKIIINSVFLGIGQFKYIKTKDIISIRSRSRTRE